jgi:hypothetical protein
LVAENVMTMEWTGSIGGRNDFGGRESRTGKSWVRIRDDEIGLSIDDGKTILKTLQAAVVNQEMETYALFRGVCPDCHTFRPVKDNTKRRIRTVFGTVEAQRALLLVPPNPCP